MKALSQKLCAAHAVLFGLTLALPPAHATLLNDPLGGVPGVHRHADEIHLLGDFDADGAVDDWLLIEKETGIATLVEGLGVNPVFTAGGWADDYRVSVSEWFRIYAGLEDIDDAVACAVNTTLSVGATNYTIDSGFAVASSTHNRLVLTLNPGDLGRNPAVASIGRTLTHIGPVGLVAQGLADAGAGSGNDSLYVLSEATGAGAAGQVFECLSLPFDSPATQNASFAIGVGESLRGFQSADAENRFFVLRDSALSSHLLLVESGPLAKTLSVVDTSPLLGAGTEMTFGRFTGSPDKLECIFWQEGSSTVQFTQLSADTFSALESADLGQAPRFIAAVANSNIFIVIFEDDSAASYTWDGPGNAPKYHYDLGSTLHGGFTGILTYPNGSIGLLDGGGGLSTHLRPFAFLEDGTGFAERPSIELPQNIPSGSRGNAITAMTYSGTPLEDDGATPLEALRFGDWGDGWFGASGGDVNIRALTFDPSLGLSYMFASRAGLVQAYDDVLVNQVSENVSAYVGAGSVGPIGPSVSITPNPVQPLASPVAPEVSVSLPGSTVYYRYGGASDWATSADGILPPVADDTVVEVFAKSPAGVPGSVATYRYTFLTPAGERDSDGDGVPDAIEAGYGLDPTSGPDADGDGVTDLVEIVYELDEADAGSPLPTPAVSDPAVFPATGNYPYSGYPVALDAGGLLELDIAVRSSVAESSVSASQFVALAPGFDSTGVLSPASGMIRVQSTSGAGLGSGLLGAGDARVLAAGVSPRDFQIVLGTDRAMALLPVHRQVSENFNLADGGWRYSNNAICPRLSYAERPEDFYLSVTSKTGRNEVVNRTAAWTGDWLGDGVDGIRVRASNFDKSTSAHLRVVIKDSQPAPNTSYWVSREAAVLAPAVQNDASGRAEAPWHELAWPIELPEPFTDANGNSAWDEGEAWVDTDGDGQWSAGSFVRLEGAASLNAVLADVAEVKIIHSEELAIESPLGFDGFHLDNIRFMDTDASAARMLAVMPAPEFAHPFVSFSEIGGNTFAENVEAWNAQREAAWQLTASMQVTVDPASTLAYLLYESALEQGLDNLAPSNVARNLGHLRDADEVTPITGRDVTLESGETASGVNFSAPSDQLVDANPSTITFPEVSLTGAIVSNVLSFPGGEPGVWVDFDKAFYDEFFTVSQQGQLTYRGFFDNSAIEMEELTAATPLTKDELWNLYFPSAENAYQPIYADIFKAVDPAEALDSITRAVEANFLASSELSALVTALYRLNSAFAAQAPESFDDPVRALRGFLREGEAGLGGPALSGSPRWRAGLAALGINSAQLAAAQSQAEAILTAARSSRTVILSETLEIIGGAGTLLDRVVDSGAGTVQLVDRDGEAFPMPESFPLDAGTQFTVTGYELDPSASGDRVIEVVSIDLEHLPRAPVVDSDGDFLDDRWEMIFHGDMDQIGMEDSDGDGFLDFEEFVRGTDPASAADYPSGIAKELLLDLKIEIDGSGNALVRLPMDSTFFEELGYQVLESPILDGTWDTRVPENSYAEGNEQVFVIPPSGNDSFFYRLNLFLK